MVHFFVTSYATLPYKVEHYLEFNKTGLDGKASAYNAGDQGSTLGREDVLEKEMATHSSILAWKIPWTEKTDSLQSIESQGVGHDWATSL